MFKLPDFSLPRLSLWLIITIVCTMAIAMIAPHQLPVTLYKLSLVSLAAVVGYWVDRHLFPYARPNETAEAIAGIAMLRRAIVVAAVVIAMALGA